MRFLLIAILLVSITLTGCSNVRTYTFKKERVDQRLEGNRGYLMGTPPPAPVEREVPKRTLIGVDIEIPILPGEEVEISPEKGVAVEKETVIVEEEVIPEEEEAEEGSFESKPKAPAPVKQEEGIEEEWVK